MAKKKGEITEEDRKKARENSIKAFAERRAALEAIREVEEGNHVTVAAMLRVMKVFYGLAAKMEKRYRGCLTKQMRAERAAKRAAKRLEASRKGLRDNGRLEDEVERMTTRLRQELQEAILEEERAVKETDKWEERMRSRYREVVAVADKAAPYCTPRLAAVEKHITGNTTKVNVHVKAEDLLTPYRDAVRALVGGSLGASAGALLPDGASEPLDSREAIPQAGDVPPQPST